MTKKWKALQCRHLESIFPN